MRVLVRIAPVVELGDQVVGHILTARDEVTSRTQAAVVRQIGGYGLAEPVAIAAGQAVRLRFGLGGIGCAHVQRAEDVFLHIVLEGLSGNRLDDQPQDGVVDGAVLVRLANRLGQRDSRVTPARLPRAPRRSNQDCPETPCPSWWTDRWSGSTDGEP